MRNLLFLAYYFPPSGGVLRLVKLAKYLPEFGWRPLVVCPRPRGIYRHDPGLLAELGGSLIFRTPSLDPTFLMPPRADAARIRGRRQVIDRLNQLFVPDNKLGWAPFAVSCGLKLSRFYTIDAIFSSAPPFSSHLAGVMLKKLLCRPLVCDFRDAWSQPNTLNISLPGWHRAADRALERWATVNSDLVTSINRPIMEGLQGFDAAPAGRFALLPQGYDPDDFSGGLGPVPDRDRFTIAYTGTITEHRRLDVIARAFLTLSQDHPHLGKRLAFAMAGVHRPDDLSPFTEHGLTASLRVHGYLPHGEILEMLRRADALWMVVGPREGPTVSTSKIYEYLGAKKPILASVPPDGPAAALIRETGAGLVFDPDDHLSLAEAIGKLCRDKFAGRSLYRGDPAAVSKYDRRRIAGRFARQLEMLVRF